MRKGIVRIILGIGLLCLQVASFAGNSNGGSIHTEASLYTLLYLIGYLFPGICGLVSLIFGIKAYRSGETANIILHRNKKKSHKIIKYIFVSLLSFNLLIGLGIYISGFSVDLMLIVSVVLMLLYLLLYQNKKPSFLFSAAVVLAGIGSLYGVLSNLLDILVYKRITAIPYLAIGILYLLVGIMIYREKFSSKCIRVLGTTAFVLDMVMVIYYRSMFWAFIPFLTDIILPSAIFVYTCIVPIYNTIEQETT